MNWSFGEVEKKFSINLSKAKTSFFLSFHYNRDYFFIEKKYMFKADNEIVNFVTQFCLGRISNGFGVAQSREVFLKENVQDISVDYNVIGESNILNIRKYIMVKSNIK